MHALPGCCEETGEAQLGRHTRNRGRHGAAALRAELHGDDRAQGRNLDRYRAAAKDVPLRRSAGRRRAGKRASKSVADAIRRRRAGEYFEEIETRELASTLTS